jgi:uncharacterized phage protein gp47/JayE
MAQTAQDISNSIRASLSVLDPDISTEPITPERKIIDSVAQAIANAGVDTFVSNYQFDIDTKVGADLDKFVALFGFARQGGRSSNGVITFNRTSTSTVDYFIPAGTQITKPASSVSNAVVFQTTLDSTIYSGTTSADAPIECTVVGIVGNVPAFTITSVNSISGSGITSVTNNDPTTGGTNLETDDELRVRFKNTVFRNISGTSDQYLALAISSRFADKANVIGPTSRFIEYLQISAAAATSIIPYSKYTYSFDYWLTDGNFTNETFFNPNGADYTFNPTVPPSFSVNNTANLPNGKIVLLEHTYTSKNSRNIPGSNVTNYIDVYVSGTDDQTASEACIFPTTANNFSSSGGSSFYNQNFKRQQTGAFPTVGNRLQILLWQPVDILPSSITIGVNTFNINFDYWLVKDNTLNKGSRRGWDGIEWTSAAATTIGAGTSFQLAYIFNKLTLTLNELMEAHKQITTDILVHAATQRYFRVALTIMYAAGFSQSAVDNAITQALTSFLQKLQFGAVIQVSDILETAHEVPGVDNVRLTTNIENGSVYGVQELAIDGSTVLNTYTSDFTIQDSDLAVLNSIVTLPKSQNTWNTF